MIKVGIAGADDPVAGELLRLCIHHPDVDIISAYAPAHAGKSLSAVHHGFIGEEQVLFSSHFDATALDVAFIVKPIYSESDWAKLMADKPSLKLILFPAAIHLAEYIQSPVYGLSEMNRKSLVRGARIAIVPDSVASPVITALYPLASHLMLSGDLSIKVSGPADIISSAKIEDSAKEIKRELSRIQTSFVGNVDISAEDSGLPRAMTINMEIPSSTSIDELLRIYDSIYDDHNFTFVVTHPIGPEEVEATNKIVISLTKPDPDRLSITVAADPRMRGGAGEAMHLMNLLMGLHEKTGLDLKTTTWR